MTSMIRTPDRQKDFTREEEQAAAWLQDSTEWMAAAGPLVDANMPVEGPGSLNPRAIALSILVVFQGLLMVLLFLAW